MNLQTIATEVVAEHPKRAETARENEADFNLLMGITYGRFHGMATIAEASNAVKTALDERARNERWTRNSFEAI